MLKACLVLFLVLSLLLSSEANLTRVFAWSNGGFSSDPANPNYGTHDWIAQHALDWLPIGEKQYIVDNLAVFLYGTELPDNGGASDGIGDTGLHHAYYFSNGAVQDDASALRAQDEFVKAVDFYVAGDVSNAVERLGVVSHYVSDVAVFGHVMGSSTDWSKETHHSDYEAYVEERTNNYSDAFNSFLAFDGSLGAVSAYNATMTLAFDTTFDVNGNLTCLWMDNNYNRSNMVFGNRCRESLNLAVNVVADVLHTFYVQAAVPKFPIYVILLPFVVFIVAVLFFLSRRKKKGT